MKPNLATHSLVFLFLLLTKSGISQNFDESNFYRLTNQATGESQSLDVFNDNARKTVLLSPSGSYSGQSWKFKQQSNGYYRITCEWVEGKSLAVVTDKEKNKLYLADTKNYTNQLWAITSLDDGYFQISSVWIGADKSLGLIRNSANSKLQLVPSDNSANQKWLITPFSENSDTGKNKVDEQPSKDNGSLNLTEEEQKLYNLVMEYRKNNGLPGIELSPSLTVVAQTHVKDLAINQPHKCNGNMHSWSDKGKWTPCCFIFNVTSECMWNKPKELTSYQGSGYEISFGSGNPEAQATAEGSLIGWKKSSGHNDVILNKNGWKEFPWKAIGIGINKGFAVIWFGTEPDED